MKILIVSFYFPPFNAVGAIRIGKFAKYLAQDNHEIKILTVNNQPWMPNLPIEIEEKNIIRTSWFNINKPIQLLLGGNKSISAQGFDRAGRLPGFIKKMGYYYKDFVNFPDGQIGWYPFAVNAIKKTLKVWKPDFIFSSSSPPTSFLIARKLAKLYEIPWIADFRDLWGDNQNSELYQTPIRRQFDKKMEKWVVSTASAIVTVSEPLAENLRNKFNKPVAVVTNGYDLDDYPKRDSNNDKSILRIVYTGIIHSTRRDPAPLFQAISLLGDDSRKVKIDFYGRNNAIIKQLASDYGMGDIVGCHDTVSYSQSLNLQVNADILLLLTYNADKDKGVITTKFFEYLGARRPILLIGCINGVAANLINERQAGFVGNDPIKIADFLKKCLKNKETGQVDQLPQEAIQGFSRKEQTSKLVQFLSEIKN